MTLFPDSRPAVDRNVVPVGRNHPQTSKDAAARKMPRSGSQRSLVLDLIKSMGGTTDDELEVGLNLTHQSASAARNTLMNDGWIKDSGKRRKTRQGFDAIVWIYNDLTPPPVVTPEPEPEPTPEIPQQRTRAEVVEQIICCTKCALHTQCTSPVAFRGPSPATIAIVGEAPGAQEDKVGKPFIGPAGELLQKSLREVNIDPDECFILNTVSCFPKGSPEKWAVAACRQNKLDQLMLASPTWVLLFGKVAMSASKYVPNFTAARGRPFRPGSDMGPVYFSTYHPAGALRNGNYMDIMVGDLKVFSDMVHAGVEKWTDSVVQNCWHCGSEEVVWTEIDYSMWCETHAPQEFHDRVALTAPSKSG